MLGDGLPRHRPTSGPRHAVWFPTHRRQPFVPVSLFFASDPYSWGYSCHLEMASTLLFDILRTSFTPSVPTKIQRVAGQPVNRFSFSICVADLMHAEWSAGTPRLPGTSPNVAGKNADPQKCPTSNGNSARRTVGKVRRARTLRVEDSGRRGRRAPPSLPSQDPRPARFLDVVFVGPRVLKTGRWRLIPRRVARANGEQAPETGDAARPSRSGWRWAAGFS